MQEKLIHSNRSEIEKEKKEAGKETNKSFSPGLIYLFMT